MQVRTAVDAGQRVRGGAVRRHHVEHKPERVRSGPTPGQAWHHVMGVDIDDELATASKRMLTGRQVLRRRDVIAAARTRTVPG